MKFLLLPLVAFVASLLTFFSGFGLGTLLTPVFAFFFPLEVSITLTAIVHLLNNLFKAVLLRQHVNKQVLVRFGLPAVLASFLGAALLHLVGKQPPLWTYEMLGKSFSILPMKSLVGILIIGFSLFESSSHLQSLHLPKRYLPLGGFLSGLFGGLSGHQGALRTLFLKKMDLSKEAFLATGVLIACLVDISRLSLYLKEQFSLSMLKTNAALLGTATGTAFLGAYLGNRLLTKITMKGIQYLVSFALILFGIALILGWI